MKNLKIKKIIAVMTALTSMMILAACGSSDADSTVSNQNDSNVEVTESTIEEEQINDNADEGGSSFIEALTPTHTTAAEWPFEVAGKYGSLFLPGQAISDLSTMTNGRYEIKPSWEYKKILGVDLDEYLLIDYSWEELKDLKMSYLDTYTGNYFFYIQCDEYDSGSYFVKIEFDQYIDGIEDMTVGEAVEQEYWKYSLFNYNDSLSWGAFSTTPLPEDDSKGIVDHIIDIWGMPSEVFYTMGENPTYTLVYQTENCNIAIYGYYEWEHLTVPNTVQNVFVYGKNTIPYPQYFDRYEKME